MLFVGAKIDYFGSFFDGEYTDFTNQWFLIIAAQVVLNSLGNLVSPPIAYYYNEIVFQISMCLD